MSVIGHADRAGPLRDYCLGLIMPGERKSVEPMAAVTAPERTAAQHQSLLHFADRMLALFGKAGVVDDPRFDRAVALDRRQDRLSDLGQHLLVRPR